MEKLDKILRAIGWSRSEFGRRIGKSPSHIDSWCYGKRPIPPWALQYAIDVKDAIERARRNRPDFTSGETKSMSASNKPVDPRVEVVARAIEHAKVAVGGFYYEFREKPHVIRDHSKEVFGGKMVIIWEGDDYEEYHRQLEIIPFERAIRALDEYEARKK